MIYLYLSACSENLLINASKTDPDEDYYYQSLNSLNNQDYDSAIAVINKISTSSQSIVKVRELLASAYAGKCGLNFLNYTQGLSQQTSGSAMSIMRAPFINQTISDPAFCKLALQTMELIGPTELRTAQQNLFVSVTGMVLLGTAARNYTDQMPALGDGTTDVDVCAVVTDSQIDDMILGFGFFNKNFSAVSATLIGGTTNSSLNSVSAACTATAGAGCNVILQSDINPAMRTAFRDIANTKDYGIGLVDVSGNTALIPGACP